MRGRNRYLLGALVASFFVAGVAPAAVGGARVCVLGTDCRPLFEFDLGAKVSPQLLPRGKPAPVRLGLNGRIKQGPPLALREAVLNVDKDVGIDVRGMPVCRANRRDIGPANFLRRLEKACVGTIVGRGRVGILVNSAGQSPRSLSSRAIVFNGGVRNGAILLHAAAEISVPRPSLLNVRIEARRKGSGWTALVKTPVIAGGSGAITHFALNLGRRYSYRGQRRSFLLARCPHGKFKFSVPKLLFRNEANVPGAAAQTVLKGNLLAPCKPKR